MCGLAQSAERHRVNGTRRAAAAWSPRGFSLIEALIALSVMSLAGAVLLLSVQSSLESTTDAVERTIADGIAQRMLHEIVIKRYVQPGGDPLATTLGPSASEQLGAGTSLFNEVGDYAGYTAQPIKGTFGEILGSGDDNGNTRLHNFHVRSDFFQNWKIYVDEYYVTQADHSVTSITPTNFRVIEVKVDAIKTSGAAVPLANRKRVVAYLPPPP